MAAKPKTQTDTKAKKADSTAPKADVAKPEAAKTEAAAETSTSASDADSGGGSKKSSAPSRPISYFSSVSTNEYRSGWDDIFNTGGKKPARQRAKPVAKRNNKLPVTITLDADDLNEATRQQLEALFRQDAKKKRLNYDKLAGNGQVRWEISCNISD